MKRFKAMSLLLAISMTAALLAGCSGGSTPEASPQASAAAIAEGTKVESTAETVYQRKTEAGTLTVGTTSVAVQALDPCNLSNAPGVHLEYDTLVRLNKQTGEIEPWLAESFKYEDDKTIYFKLRDNIYFHKGEHMTAEDVFFSLKRIVDSGSRQAPNYNTIDWDKSEIISDYEFKLVTAETTGTLLNYLSVWYASILCKSHVEKYGNDSFWDNNNGSGPYILTQNISDDRQVFEINKNYWGEVPGFNTITIRQYSEATTMFIDYENGALDVVYGVSANYAQRVLDGQVSNSNIEIANACRQSILGMYDNSDYLSDVNVRTAVACAIDTAALTKVAYGLLGTPATSYVPHGTKYRSEITMPAYDPDKARQLLADAGYKDGDITLKFVTTTEATNKKVAETVQAMLSDVGIKVNVETYDQPTAIAMLRGVNNNGVPECDLGIMEMFMSASDPDQQMSVIYIDGGFGLMANHDDKVNDLIRQGKYTIDAKVRTETYKELFDYMAQQVYSLPLVEAYTAVVYRDYVQSVPTDDPIEPNLTKVQFK